MLQTQLLNVNYFFREMYIYIYHKPFAQSVYVACFDQFAIPDIVTNKIDGQENVPPIFKSQKFKT